MQLLNTWLVGRTLRIMGRSPRIRALGMLLYGLNPLVLLESAQNAYNDVVMLTFVLLGILLLARAEQRGELLRARVAIYRHSWHSPWLPWSNTPYSRCSRHI